MIQSANATRDDLINARSALLDAENAYGKAFDENAFVNGVNVLKETSPSLTGASNSAREATRNMADNLIEAFTSSKNAYTEQFNNLPNGIGFDVEGLTDIMTRLKSNTGDFGEITSNAYKKDPIATMLAMLSPQKTGVDTVPEIIPERLRAQLQVQLDISVVRDADIEFYKPILEKPEELATRLMNDGVDLKQLYKVVRPNISKLIDSIQINGSKVPEELYELKKFIDDLLPNSGDPSFQAAMDSYIKHEATYNANTLLQQFSRAADNVNESLTVNPEHQVSEWWKPNKRALISFNNLWIVMCRISVQLKNALTASGVEDPFGHLASIYMSQMVKSASRNLKMVMHTKLS